MSEEIKQKLKFEELRKRYREVEGENDLLQEKLHRAQKSIKRLRLERSILLERIDRGYEGNSDSDVSSDILIDTDLMDKHASPIHHKAKHEKNHSTTTVIKPPKKKKDPNAPKGPGNVFFLFCRLERDKMKDEYPDESIGDVTKLLGLKWKGLSREEKQVYYDTFKREMDEYEEAMKVYKSNGQAPAEDSLDPTDTSVKPESLMSSPVIAPSPASPDIIAQHITPIVDSSPHATTFVNEQDDYLPHQQNVYHRPIYSSNNNNSQQPAFNSPPTPTILQQQSGYQPNRVSMMLEKPIANPPPSFDRHHI